MEELSASLAIELEDSSGEEDEDEWQPLSQSYPAKYSSQQHQEATSSSSSATLHASSSPSTLTRWILMPVLSEEIVGLREEERLSGRGRLDDSIHGMDSQEGQIYEGCLAKIVVVVNIISASGQ